MCVCEYQGGAPNTQDHRKDIYQQQRRMPLDGRVRIDFRLFTAVFFLENASIQLFPEVESYLFTQLHLITSLLW